MRLPPLPADQWDDAVQQALAVMLPEERRNPENASNILGTFVNHPALTKEFLRFNVHLLFNSTLPPRLRELAILRVAHRTDSAYEWMQHVKMGRRVGLTEDDIAGVQRGEASDAFDRTVLAAVDELLEKYNLSDATWAALGERFDNRTSGRIREGREDRPGLVAHAAAYAQARSSSAIPHSATGAVSVTITRVRPVSINTLPSALGMKSGVIFTGRKSCGPRPSARTHFSFGRLLGCFGKQV